MVQLDSSALGRVVNATALNDLPLVTRNFTQISGLSPGVLAGVDNAIMSLESARIAHNGAANVRKVN